MIRVRNAGKNHGDCFFIEIESSVHRSVIMVDGRNGGQSFEEIKRVILAYGSIDYLIVTHIDMDHINGILKIFEQPETDAVRKAFDHTVILYNYVTKPVINYSQAREFEKLIRNNEVVSTITQNYNRYFSPCLKILSAAKRKELDPREQEGFEDYAVMTILHPLKEGVEKVYNDYLAHPEKPNAKLVNRNSIVFLLEYGEWTGLFTGDCYIRDIADRVDQLKNMKNAEGYRKIDMIKIPHHGARDNNEGLAEFVRNHNTYEFFVTASECVNKNHPLNEILKKLDDAAGKGTEGGKKMVVHTHTNVPKPDDLKHIIIDNSDDVEWGNGR